MARPDTSEDTDQGKKASRTAEPMASGMGAAVGGDFGGGAAYTAPGLGGLRTFDSFRNRHFRLYFAGMMGQMGAMNMQMMARAWFIYDLTGSAAMLGAVALASAAPMLFLALFGGVMADRVEKKYVMVAGQAASGVIALGVALAISLDVITPSYLILAGVLQGIVMGLMMPSRQAVIPEIVGEEGLMNAVSLNAAGMNVNRLLAPAVAGFLISQMGIAGVYYAMTGLYVLATFFVAALPRTGITSLRGGGALTHLKEGVRYIRHNTTILAVLLLTLITVILSMPYMFLLPIFTEDILDVGPQGLGVLISVSGVGAIAGSLIIASLGNRNRGRLLLLSCLVLGLSLIGFSASTWYLLSILLVIPIGFGQAGRMALSNTLVQAYADHEHRGRVMSFYMMEFGLMSFATFGVSILAEFIGIQWALGGMAGLLILVTLYYFAFVPGIRRLD